MPAIASATIKATTLTGTLSTAAQPNVTSLGTLTSLTVSGDAKGSFWRAEGTPAGSGTGVGMEVFVSGTEAYLQAYNRTTSAVATMRFNGASYRFLTNAVTIDNGLTVSAGTTAVQALTATTGTLTAVAPTVAAGQVGLGATTQTTVGAAGAASALPANPTGYLIINVAGTNRVVPFYNA